MMSDTTVVLPLLRLAGRKQLQGRNKRFARYALESGVLAAAGDAGSAMAAVNEALALRQEADLVMEVAR